MSVKDAAVHRESAGRFSRASACCLRRPFSPSQQRHALCSHRDAGDDDRHSEGPGWTADGRSGGILDRRSFHFPSSILVSLNEKNRSEEHTSELQSLMRISYAVFCLKKKTYTKN